MLYFSPIAIETGSWSVVISFWTKLPLFRSILKTACSSRSHTNRWDSFMAIPHGEIKVWLLLETMSFSKFKPTSPPLLLSPLTIRNSMTPPFESNFFAQAVDRIAAICWAVKSLNDAAKNLLFTAKPFHINTKYNNKKNKILSSLLVCLIKATVFL